MSDIVAKYILKIIDESGGNAEIQRNVLANELGCVPSQINYVITSRFTPEQGYIVESKRGGGGYIRITRVDMDKSSILMHVVNSVGNKISFSTTAMMLQNLYQQDAIDLNTTKLISAATQERAYKEVPVQYRDYLRASVLKQMLLTQI